MQKLLLLGYPRKGISPKISEIATLDEALTWLRRTYGILVASHILIEDKKPLFAFSIIKYDRKWGKIERLNDTAYHRNVEIAKREVVTKALKRILKK